MALYEEASKPDPTSIAESLTYLGELYQNEGLYSKAEPLFKKSMKVAPEGYTARGIIVWKTQVEIKQRQN